jgi:hypothetical protein
VTFKHRLFDRRHLRDGDVGLLATSAFSRLFPRNFVSTPTRHTCR